LTPRLKGSAAQVMGRPKKTNADKKARLSITIRQDIMRCVEALAEAEHRTISGTIEYALNEYVNARKNMIKKIDAKSRNT